MVRGYKTLAYDAVTLMARIPPLYLLASKQRRIYTRCKGLALLGELTAEKKKEIRDSAKLLLRRQWYAHLSNPNLPGARVRTYILPIFNEWLDRKHGSLTHHLTQLITGHGSFGVFLARIGKIRSATCPYCREEEDSSQHTLQVCVRWEEERETLRKSLGWNLELGAVIRAITYDSGKWEAACTFANTVLQIKESDEWDRQKARRDADYFGVSASEDSED